MKIGEEYIYQKYDRIKIVRSCTGINIGWGNKNGNRSGNSKVNRMGIDLGIRNEIGWVE